MIKSDQLHIDNIDVFCEKGSIAWFLANELHQVMETSAQLNSGGRGRGLDLAYKLYSFLHALVM